MDHLAQPKVLGELRGRKLHKMNSMRICLKTVLGETKSGSRTAMKLISRINLSRMIMRKKTMMIIILKTDLLFLFHCYYQINI
jgi:hypothetical protein